MKIEKNSLFVLQIKNLKNFRRFFFGKNESKIDEEISKNTSIFNK